MRRNLVVCLFLIGGCERPEPKVVDTALPADDDDDDDDDDPCQTSTFYADADGDSFGNADASVEACERPDGFVDDATDCDDAAADIFPGATEEDCDDPVDRNCDGSVGYADVDGDGFAACVDCDDSEQSISPLATEVCDGVDNDCDGSIDVDAVDESVWYVDDDEDGFGLTASGAQACDAPSGTVAFDGDCDDDDEDVFPGADELCNSVDDDCDGDVDEAPVDASTWYADADEDTFGGELSVVACIAPSGFVATSTDCDDTCPSCNPDAPEVCDGVDNNCDDSIDEPGATGEQTWYIDEDEDGYAGNAMTVFGCSGPPGSELQPTDCDDDDDAINPGADEVCDALDVDEDCNTLSNDQDPFVTGTTTFYVDDDDDDWGTQVEVQACSEPPFTAALSGDCDDNAPAINPDATEICDGIDNDCDVQTTESDCPKLVFVTSEFFSADLGGIAGADQKCQDAADDAGIPGTFMAWLSTDSISVNDRFTPSLFGYERVDGVTVVDSWADLTIGGPLQAPIEITELNTVVSNAPATFCVPFMPAAWSNTSFDGNAQPQDKDCSDWTSTTSEGRIGLPNQTATNWSTSCQGFVCDRTASLYCFEQ